MDSHGANTPQQTARFAEERRRAKARQAACQWLVRCGPRAVAYHDCRGTSSPACTMRPDGGRGDLTVESVTPGYAKSLSSNKNSASNIAIMLYTKLYNRAARK